MYHVGGWRVSLLLVLISLSAPLSASTDIHLSPCDGPAVANRISPFRLHISLVLIGSPLSLRSAQALYLTPLPNNCIVSYLALPLRITVRGKNKTCTASTAFPRYQLTRSSFADPHQISTQPPPLNSWSNPRVCVASGWPNETPHRC
jgi:hypothetical protein